MPRANSADALLSACCLLSSATLWKLRYPAQLPSSSDPSQIFALLRCWLQCLPDASSVDESWCLQEMYERKVTAGEILIKEGDTGAAASELFVVKDGEFEVSSQDANTLLHLLLTTYC